MLAFLSHNRRDVGRRIVEKLRKRPDAIKDELDRAECYIGTPCASYADSLAQCFVGRKRLVLGMAGEKTLRF